MKANNTRVFNLTIKITETFDLTIQYMFSELNDCLQQLSCHSTIFNM